MPPDARWNSLGCELSITADSSNIAYYFQYLYTAEDIQGMALEGSLKDFGLADILQLIYFQRKTGVLVLDGKQTRSNSCSWMATLLELSPGGETRIIALQDPGKKRAH